MNPTEINNPLSKKKIIAGIVIIIIVAAAALYAIYSNKKANYHAPVITDITESTLSSASATTGTAATASSTDPLRQALLNLSYGLKEPQTKLVSGYFIGKFEDCGGYSCNGITYYSHMKLSDVMAVGDLNGDGEKDAVVVMGSATTQSPKIEGVQYTRQDIAAVVKQGSTYKNIAAVELTDDISALTTSIEKISIKKGIIYVTVIRNLGSMNLSYPTATEEIQLKLNPAYTSGFALFKNGVPENPSDLVQPDITKAAVSTNTVNKTLTLTGNNFSMFRNTVVLTSAGGVGTVYKSIVVESSKNNSSIIIPLSNIGFPEPQGNVSSKPYEVKPIPGGTYNVTVEAEVCVQGQVCQTIVSNAVEVKI